MANSPPRRSADDDADANRDAKSIAQNSTLQSFDINLRDTKISDQAGVYELGPAKMLCEG